MDEYISREETAKAFCEKCRGYYDGHCIHRGECDVDVIQTAPAADVQPVKHGHWIEHPDDIFPLESTIECSVCGEQESVNIHNDNFCPNCGCKMGGDSE